MDTRIYRAYRTLGLTPGASAEEIKQAHRDLAQVWHPDRLGGNPRLREKAERNLQRINEAYDVLKSYTPPADLRVSRVTASISAILDLGDLVQETLSSRGAPRSPPVRARPRRTILGLGFAGRHEPTSVRTPVRITIALVLLVIVLLLLLR